MAATTPPGPEPDDRDHLSEAVDEMEERVVGRRVDPPHSDDVADPDDTGDSGEGPGDEPS
ncbi:hypothetical protein [Pseudonocardia lacus]|uniref:hypothetical protein n=1 Tax=Pseudonocardia lacus TaxID=2835865 RepID=UPI001BDD272E|nr:hypothetical protein [Pseudonocardia lacus]